MKKLYHYTQFFHQLWRKVINESEQGATLIYVSLSMMAMLGFAGLALDGGYAYSQQNRMQVAADAAALAGARLVALEEDLSMVGAKVQQMANANGAPEVSWHLINDGSGVHVEVSRTYKTWFMRLFGHHTMTTGAMAEAEAIGVSGVGGLLPLTTMCTDAGFSEGTVYTLWDSDMDIPGSFGWLDWSGGSGSSGELAGNLSNPANSGDWNIGDWIPAGPRVTNSAAVRNAIKNWLGRNATIPLYSAVSGEGDDASYQICGFAEFVITGYKFKGGDKWVQGIFVHNIKYGDVPPTNGADFGVRDVRLIQ